MGPLFKLGQIVATPAALDLLEDSGVHAQDLLRRHLTGDWGKVCKEDAAENDFSVKNGFRILSSYDVGSETLWIITEADRSVTTLLLPEDY